MWWYINRFSDKDKRKTWNLKASCRFTDNLPQTDSNIKLLQCYGIFLTSLNRNCTKVKIHLNSVMTEHIKDRSRKPSTLQVRDRVVTLASPSLMLKHRTVVYFPVPCKWNIIFFREPRRTGTSPLICFTNQFTDFYITQISTVSHLQTCSSMKIIKAPQRESNIWNTPGILTTLKTKLNLAFNIIRTPKSYHKLRHYGPFENSLQRKKPHHV